MSKHLKISAKVLLIIAVVIGCVCMFSACQNKQQNDAKDLKNEIQTTAKANSPGFVSTSRNGYWMSAKLDGKGWTASAMVAADHGDSKRIQGENDDASIGFYIGMRGLEAGKHIALSDDNGADLMTHDDIGIWGGRNGEIVITKIDNSVMEGTFTFTASSTRTNKTVAVTDGIFRFPLAEK